MGNFPPTLSAAASGMRVRGARLTVTRGVDAQRSVVISQPVFVIGSGEGADLRLQDAEVSRTHVRIALTGNGLRLRDESKNGTWIGGLSVHDVLLTTDASIVIGGTTIAVSLDKDLLVLPLSQSDRFGDALGTSRVMRNIFADLEKVAPTELTVLLEGESGTGKDVLARAIHAHSARAAAPLVVLDCASIPAALVESELFGHKRGAFTGADRDRAGVFEEANGGTLFLDEIGDLPLETQPKLLRAIEAREIRPVGARRPQPIDVRIIAATSRRLAEAVRTGEFRSDLFYRLAVARVVVPPLRERAEDILPIARLLLRTVAHGRNTELPPDLASMITGYAWPGNVRELRNVMERWATFGKTDRSLFDGETASEETATVHRSELPYLEARQRVLGEFEEQYVRDVLARAGGVVARAAELAQIARPSFYRLMDRLHLRDEP